MCVCVCVCALLSDWCGVRVWGVIGVVVRGVVCDWCGVRGVVCDWCGVRGVVCDWCGVTACSLALLRDECPFFGSQRVIFSAFSLPPSLHLAGLMGVEDLLTDTFSIYCCYKNEKTFKNEQRSRDAAAKKRANTSGVGKSNNYCEDIYIPP